MEGEVDICAPARGHHGGQEFSELRALVSEAFLKELLPQSTKISCEQKRALREDRRSSAALVSRRVLGQQQVHQSREGFSDQTVLQYLQQDFAHTVSIFF